MANISIYIKPRLMILLTFMYSKEPNAEITNESPTWQQVQLIDSITHNASPPNEAMTQDHNHHRGNICTGTNGNGAGRLDRRGEH